MTSFNQKVVFFDSTARKTHGSKVIPGHQSRRSYMSY